MKIIGHESIISFFTHCIEENRLSHAYAFCGSTHVGKRTVAEHVVRKLLGCSAEGILVHPDLSIIEREIDEKTGTRKKDISIGQIRDLNRRLSQSAFVKDGYVVAIIDGAEHLNISAANALLKTLEEPHAKTVIFLISHDEGLMLPTIRSRVQSIYFSPVSETFISNFLISQGVEENHAVELASDSHGLPGYACRWAADSLFYDEYLQEKKRCQSLMQMPFYEKLAVIEDLFGDKTDHIEARATIIEALTIWTFTLRDMMIGKDNIRITNKSNLRIGEGKEVPTITVLVDQIREAKEQLRKNIHPRLVLENILLTIP